VGVGAVSPQTQPIEFQSCIPAPWRNGLLKKVFQRRVFRKYNWAKSFIHLSTAPGLKFNSGLSLRKESLGKQEFF
jgi:hypothetical protein